MAKERLGMEREEIIGYLIGGYIGAEQLGGKLDIGNQLAVERYMRTYLRALTLVELEYELKFCDDNHRLSPVLSFKVGQARKGYDAFMARRLAKVR